MAIIDTDVAVTMSFSVFVYEGRAIVTRERHTVTREIYNHNMYSNFYSKNVVIVHVVM